MANLPFQSKILLQQLPEPAASWSTQSSVLVYFRSEYVVKEEEEEEDEWSL
jgi:hypothetical protein